MILPYQHRIVTVIMGEIVELSRFQRPIHPSDVRFWTSDLTTPWWTETPLRDNETITPRPVLTDYCKLRPALRMKHSEHVALENMGIQPEYKL